MWSNKYINIPFLDKGRAENGSDCWGLVRIIYEKELGIDLPELSGYENTKDTKSIQEIVRINSELSEWVKIEPGQEKTFDVLIFSVAGDLCHVGVVVDKGLMVHCQKNSNTTHCEYLKDRSWSGRMKAVYRHATNTDSPITV